MCLSRVRRAQNDALIPYYQFGLTEIEMTLLAIAKIKFESHVRYYAFHKAELKRLTVEERGSHFGRMLADATLERNKQMDAKEERFVELYEEEHGVVEIARRIATQIKRNIFYQYGLNDTD